MRLVRTQARTTKKYLLEAQKLVNNAIRNRDYKSLRSKLIALFGKLPEESLVLIKELAIYESGFTVRVIRKHINRNIVAVNNEKLVSIIENTPVSVALNTKPETIEDTYRMFSQAKIKQLMSIVSDSEVANEDPADTEDKVTNITNGLFSTQNLAIAGVAIISAANTARQAVVYSNNLSVEWSAVLDVATCTYCEDKDGTVYDENDTADEIPAHSNCRCTWIPVE